MDIVKLVTGLQNAANTTLTSLKIMALGKAVEKLKVGAIQSVVSPGLISPTTSNAGDLFYVESEEEIYYSTGEIVYPLSGVGTTAVYNFGKGGQGQLGNNGTSNRSSPVSILSNTVLWSNTAVGYSHNIAIAAGIAYAWGGNYRGNLGDNTSTNRSSPVTVVGGITTWTQVSGGGQSGSYGHTIGITSAGIAYAWGQNGNGQLGDNTTTSRSSPVTVVGGITTWTQISAGVRHNLGRTSAGILYAWGDNGMGRLGDGTTTARSSPVTVVGGITTWSQVSGGREYSLGRTSAGVTYGWGYNLKGQLGDNTDTSRLSPVTIVGGITTWSQVSAGGLVSLGRTSAGVAYAWGASNYGQLGDNTAGLSKSSPVTVVGGITTWSQLSSGHQHSLGVTSAGVAYAWGRNLYGELGDNTTTNRSSPVTLFGGITTWTQVNAGGRHSIALRTFT